MGKNSLCIFDREYELATYVHRNPESDMKEPLEEFFNQFKLTKDTKVETHNEDDITDDEDLDESEFDESKFNEEENNNTKKTRIQGSTTTMESIVLWITWNQNKSLHHFGNFLFN